MLIVTYNHFSLEWAISDSLILLILSYGILSRVILSYSLPYTPSLSVIVYLILYYTISYSIIIFYTMQHSLTLSSFP